MSIELLFSYYYIPPWLFDIYFYLLHKVLAQLLNKKIKTLQREKSYKNLSLPKCIPFPYELNIIELSIVPVQ